MAGALTASGDVAVAEAAEFPLEAYAGKRVVVGGKVVHVGKFSIDQWLALTRLAAKVVLAMSEDDVKTLQQAEGDIARDQSLQNVTTIADMVLPLLTEDTVLDLYALPTRLDRAFLAETFDMVEFIDTIGAVAEMNDVERIMAAFKRAAAHWKPRSPKN